MSPRVSIVVPAYENAPFIARTMGSILAQTYTDLEVIVADHTSRDRTRAVLETFTDDPRVRLLSTPRGGGAERNWNRVTRAAAGHYVKLVCGDDVVHPTLVERQVAALDAAGGRAVMSAVKRDLIDARGRTVARSRGLGRLRGVVDGRRALRATVRAGRNILGEPMCVLMTRDALAAAGGWDATYPYYIDLSTYARVLVQGDLVAIPEPLAAFRLSAGQLTVALARSHATEAAGFHALARSLAPDDVTAFDVRLGNLRARAAAHQRRAAYAVLGRRLEPEAGR